MINVLFTVAALTLHTYECVIFGMHGSYVHMTVQSDYVENAVKIAEKVRLKLVKAGKISENTTSECFLKEKSK